MNAREVIPHPDYRRWNDIVEAVDECERCEIAHASKVFGDGDSDANLAIVGEGPGFDEVIQSTVFVGRSGKLLNEAIQKAGLRRPELWICNVLRCRAFVRQGRRGKDRSPTWEEMDNCSPFLHATLGFVQPKVIVTLGLPAAQNTIRRAVNKFGNFVPEIIEEMRSPRMSMRGVILKGVKKGYTYWYKTGVQVIPTWHPAYVARERSTALFNDLVKTLKKAKAIVEEE